MSGGGPVSDHDPASRSVALEAVIRTALERAEESSRFRRKFTSEDVAGDVDGDTTVRTVRRAMKDAEALGWVASKNWGNEWTPGEKAEAFADTGEE